MSFLENLKIISIVMLCASCVVAGIAGIVISLFNHPVFLVLSATGFIVFSLALFITLIHRIV